MDQRSRHLVSLSPDRSLRTVRLNLPSSTGSAMETTFVCFTLLGCSIASLRCDAYRSKPKVRPFARSYGDLTSLADLILSFFSSSRPDDPYSDIGSRCPRGCSLWPTRATAVSRGFAVSERQD